MAVTRESGMSRRIPLPRRATWHRWLQNGASALMPLGVVVGAITGLGAVVFRVLITAFTRMLTGYDDYSGLGRVPSAHWPSLGFWFPLQTPVVAGALYGPIVYRLAPEARGHGVLEVMYAMTPKGGRRRRMPRRPVRRTAPQSNGPTG